MPDTAQQALPDGGLITQAAYAESVGKTRQYINKLVREGRLPSYGPRKMIRQDEADRLLPPSRFNDTMPAIDQHASRANGSDSGTRSSETGYGHHLTHAKAQTESIRASLAELEYRRKIGELLPRDMITEAMSEAGIRIARSIERLVREADAITETAVRGGSKEVRNMLRNKVREIRAEVADAIALPEHEGPDQ